MATGPDFPSWDTHSQSSPITGSMDRSLVSIGRTLVQSVAVFTRWMEHPTAPTSRCLPTSLHILVMAALLLFTFQENPLQNIMDVFKLQRRRVREEVETQVWKRQ